MLSYRHAYHAGNHADVLKHLCLYAILRYYRQKALPYHYMDTHAGAGLYDLSASMAQKLGEYRDGMMRLQTSASLPDLLNEFISLWQEHCPQNHYWGSPYLAALMRQADDKMRLFELHAQDVLLLREHLKALRLGRGCKIEQRDGLQGLIASLPPTPRRAVVLIDPAYELKDEYRQVLSALKEALKRFATGCYAIWYPLLNKAEMKRFEEALMRFEGRWLQARLTVRAAREDGFGMHGSAMWILNPPYTLKDELSASLPHLTRLLAQDGSASYVLKAQGL